MGKRCISQIIIPLVIFCSFYIPSSAGRYTRHEQLNWQFTTKSSNAANGTAKILTGGGEPMLKQAPHSVLASGYWYKIGVTRTGIFKLDYNLLRSAGIDLSKASNIAVYGKPGGMLPQANSVKRDQDLTENAVMLKDNNNNGVLDADDYILFYARGPETWTYDGKTKNFRHSINYYSDTAYYFITVKQDPAKHIAMKPSSTNNPDNIVTGFDDYGYHEYDQITDITTYVKSGREKYGEIFHDLSSSTIKQSFNFNFPLYDPNEQSDVKVVVLCRAFANSSFDIYQNTNQLLTTIQTPYVSSYYLDSYAMQGSADVPFTPAGSNFSIDVVFHQPTSDAQAWMNYVELNVRSRLAYIPGQFNFRDSRSVGAGKTNEFRISGAPANLQVWDVTDFHNVAAQQTSLSGNDLVFRAPADSLRQYVYSDGSNYYTPAAFGQVSNQNLHGLPQSDMVIVSAPQFLPAANRLADYHRGHDGFTIQVVTPQQIYNEFSSGAQDVSAIRDFMKMFYDRSKTDGTPPQYLLLFGDGSYDYKNYLPNNTNYVPAYEGYESLVAESSFTSDNYYAFLDNNEGWTSDDATSDSMDISVGRLPVDNLDQANAMVDKVIRYQGDKQTKGDWRTLLTFIADDVDVEPSLSNAHMLATEELTNLVQKSDPAFNIHKIYLDAYKQVSTPNGSRYPDVNTAIDNQMEAGTLLFNFKGHGSVFGLAHERVLTVDDIQSWHNYYKMPLFITATCEFSRFDDPQQVSAGELALLKPDGGLIASFTTTRVVAIPMNDYLNTSVFNARLLKKVNGKPPYIGSVFKQAQNEQGDNNNTRSFTLLGDPALRLAVPENNIVINDVKKQTAGKQDTLKALELVTFTGMVTDNSGQKMSDFNGDVYPTIYDKYSTRTTLANDGYYPTNFKVQENFLYKGKVSAKNGEFTFSFYVPKDINYSYGFGKVSIYATNGITDAFGYNDSVVVGGAVSNPVSDNDGPRIRLFMDDTNFISGGITGSNPVLIAKLSDTMGINITGNGVGHDLTATLNNGEPITLNSYFESEQDNFRKGTVTYPFTSLPDGNYTLSMRVWDVNNNSADASIDFVVVSSAKFAIDKIFNYPNPFKDRTTFSIEHNRPNEDLDMTLEIYDLQGQLITGVTSVVHPLGDRITTFDWDGTDAHGNAVSNGIYIYKIVLKTKDGQVAQQTQKLVVVK